MIGTALTDREYADLATRWINHAWADLAGFRRVDHFSGKELIGANGHGRDYAGIAIPYRLPGSASDISCRLRRDNPEIDARTHKQRNKYMAPAGGRNHIYFPPLTTLEMLRDVTLPVLITEGEYKAVALRRLASEGVDTPRFLVIAVSGIWNFQGIVGIEENEHGMRVSVKGVIPELDLLAYPNRNIAIVYDADLATKLDVRKARHMFSIELRNRGANVGYLEWDPQLGKGVDDWLANKGPDMVLGAIARIEYNNATGWQSRLLCTDTGKPKAHVENARIVLEHVPEFAGLALDEFSQRISRPIMAPWSSVDGAEWSDLDSIEFSAWLQRHRIDAGKETADDAIQIVAARNRFHPVRTYLDALVWDGQPRVDAWLTTYLGVKPDSYTSAAGRCWLISAVARIHRPGCKADSALLLIGPQGRGKSTVCRILGEPWFSDNLPDLHHQSEAQIHVAGHWIIELPELEALNRAEIELIRAWLSRLEDVYRPKYGRRTVHQPRQCVFIGSVNGDEPLRDTLGNRRWWPVAVGTIDTAALAADRDQLWAEAVDLFRSGAAWHFEDKSLIAAAEREQTERVDLHVWHDTVARWCDGRESVTVGEVLTEAIHKDLSTRTQADKLNVVRCLHVMGWKSTQRRVNGRQTRMYLNPGWEVEE